MWDIYDFLDGQGISVLHMWAAQEKLSTIVLSKLDLKIDMLRQHGTELGPGLLAGTSSGHIKKLKVTGRVTLRPMLCQGPFSQYEFTLLLGAVEKDRKLVPRDAVKQAVANRQKLVNNPTRRRIHEGFS